MYHTLQIGEISKAYQTYQFFSTFSGIECDVKNKMIASGKLAKISSTYYRL